MLLGLKGHSSADPTRRGSVGMAEHITLLGLTCSCWICWHTMLRHTEPRTLTSSNTRSQGRTGSD